MSPLPDDLVAALGALSPEARKGAAAALVLRGHALLDLALRLDPSATRTGLMFGHPVNRGPKVRWLPADLGDEPFWRRTARSWAYRAPEALKASGLSLDQFAARLGVVPLTAAGYLRRPPETRIPAIAEVLGTTPEALFQPAA